MSTNTVLPQRPNLEHLRRQAKDLRKAVRQGDTGALRRAASATTEQGPVDRNTFHDGGFSILDAQRTVAREYGFPSWAALKREVERRTLSFEERVEQFVLAVADERMGRAIQLIEDTPEIAAATFHAALVLGDTDTVRAAVDNNPELANSPGGPKKGWYPLHYVAISSFHREDPKYADGLEATTRILLENGADPNAAWVHPTWPDSSLKPLYHATGISNNAGVARLLIEAGAELDDGESLYHAAENFHLESLILLREAGADLGRTNANQWGNTPLYFILGHRNSQYSAETANQDAAWLLENGADPNIKMRDGGETALHAAIKAMRSAQIIERFLKHGADPSLPRDDGKTPYDLAVRNGDTEIITLLENSGAEKRRLTEKERFLKACMSADRETAQAIKNADPGILGSLDEEERYLFVEAAIENKVEALRVMLDLGFNITFKGSKEWSATALHWASWHGQTEACRFLLERGAPLDLPANPPEASAPLGWAIHGSTSCKNPNGDYATIVEEMIQAGAKPRKGQLGMASEQVTVVMHRYLPEEDALSVG